MEAMQSAFISSVQRGFEDVRQAVYRAIESLGMRALMAEGAGAHTESPQRALLDLVRQADVFLLLVGPRYSSPTEDEFNEARRLGKPILVLRQEGELEPEQEQFLERVAGGWKGGRLWGTFKDASDAGLEVVRAITNLRSGEQSEQLAPAAQGRAAELAGGRSGGGTYGHGSAARVALAPLVAGRLLDAIALDHPTLADTVADLARSARIVPHSVGINTRVSSEGVAIEAGGQSWGEPLIAVGTDGAITCEFSVEGSDQFGSMRVDPDRLAVGITAAAQFALAVWERIDPREEVQRVAVAVAIPQAQHKVFGPSTGGSSISMGSFSMPQDVVAPQPATIVRRADLGGEELTRRLVAEVRRAFTDAGAIQQ